MDQLLVSDYKNTPEYKRSQRLKALFVWVVSLLLLFGTMAVLWSMVVKPYFVKNSVELSSKNFTEAEVESARTVSILYGSEGVPTVRDGSKVAFEVMGSTVKTEPSGRVFFSGVYKNTNTVEPLSVYTLNIADGVIEPFKGVQGGAHGIEFTDRTSTDESFVLRALDRKEEGSNDFYGLHVVTATSSEYLDYATGRDMRSMEWSPAAGLLAYNRLVEHEVTPASRLQIKNWEVVLLDPATKSIIDVLEGAHQPKWLSDGSGLYFLGFDGLYIYNVKTKERTLVAPVGGGEVVIATSKMDLSLDDTYLLWATPKKGIVTLIEFASPLEVKQYAQLASETSEYYWPHFSPDGEHFIVQVIDKPTEQTRERTNPRMEVMRIGSTDPVKSYTFSEFDFNSFFTDDWTL